VKSAFCD